MPIDKEYLQSFKCSKHYHVYNRTNNKELLFKEDHDHHVFLSKLLRFSSGYFDLVAYCLLGNHFHFLIKIKSKKKIHTYLKTRLPRDLNTLELKYLEGTNENMIDDLILEQFRRFFISFVSGTNFKYKRIGSLFQRPFKRKQVIDKSYLRALVLYIHFNPVKHLIAKNIENYEWSSYHEHRMDSIIHFNFKLLNKIFGNEESYINAHLEPNEYLEKAALVFDDFENEA